MKLELSSMSSVMFPIFMILIVNEVLFYRLLCKRSVHSNRIGLLYDLRLS